MMLFARKQCQTTCPMLDQDVVPSNIGHFREQDGYAAPPGRPGMTIMRKRRLAAYLQRLRERPSFARAPREEEPYFAMVPK